MSAANTGSFAKVQLGLASVLTSPKLGSTLAHLKQQGPSLRTGDRLNEMFAGAGVPLPPGVNVHVAEPSPDAKVSFVICVTLSDTGPAHCTTVSFQSPITFD